MSNNRFYKYSPALQVLALDIGVHVDSYMNRCINDDGIKLLALNDTDENLDIFEELANVSEYVETQDIPDNQECQVHDNNGVVHYFDNEGVEVETFIPGWGC